MGASAEAPERPPGRPLTAVATSVAALLGLAALGLWAGDAAFSLLPGLDLPGSGLAKLHPPPASPTRRLSQRVVFIIIDGLGSARTGNMPTLNGLGARGVHMTSRPFYPSYTYPMLTTMLSGVEPRYTGVRTNRHLRALGLDTLAARVRAAGLRTALVGSDSFPARVDPESWDDVRVLPFDLDHYDRWVPPTLKLDAPLTLVYYSQVDVQGHMHGSASPEYAAAAARVDQSLGYLLTMLDLTRDTIVISADHGHRKNGGHGGTEAEVMSVPLIMVGAGIRPAPRGAEGLREARHIDLAPTMAALLGVAPPVHARGRVLTKALDLSSEEAAQMTVRDAERRKYLWPTIAAFDARGQRRRLWTGLLRSTLALVTFAGIFMISRWLNRRSWLVWDWKTVGIAAPVFTLGFYGLFFAFEGAMSLSVLREFWPVVERLFRYGFAAAGLHAVVAWLVLIGRVQPAARLSATAGLTIAGLALAVAPAIVAYAVVGGTPMVQPASSGWVFFAMLAYAGLTCYCAAAALVLALELAVLTARSGWRPRRQESLS